MIEKLEWMSEFKFKIRLIDPDDLEDFEEAQTIADNIIHKL